MCSDKLHICRGSCTLIWRCGGLKNVPHPPHPPWFLLMFSHPPREKTLHLVANLMLSSSGFPSLVAVTCSGSGFTLFLLRKSFSVTCMLPLRLASDKEKILKLYFSPKGISNRSLAILESVILHVP